jgi:hypothetical protein
LFTIAGSLLFRQGEEGKWREILPGDEVVVDINQLHEGKVGSAGWKWVAAWRSEEAERFKDVDH